MTEKGINLRIQELKESIANAANSAILPPSVLQMVFNEFATQMQTQNIKAIEMEMQAIDKENNNKTKEK